MTATPQSRSLETAIIADRMALVAMALFGIYLVTVLSAVLPPKLLDPVWQLRSTKVAVEAATLPLLGLSLLHLAAYLQPTSLRLQQQRKALSLLAVPVSLAFLLVVPLQTHAVWRSYSTSNATANQQQDVASEGAEAVRQAITQATSTADLQKRLLVMQRPDLRIQLDPSRFPAIPLPAMKRQLLNQLDRAEGQFKRRFAPIDPATADRITRDCLRVMVSSVAFAMGFAACAQRRDSRVPFLVEWPGLLAHLSPLVLLRRRRSGGENGALAAFPSTAARREAEFLASLAPTDEATHPSPDGTEFVMAGPKRD